MGLFDSGPGAVISAPMGGPGAQNSLTNFLGFGSGPTSPAMTGNAGMQQINDQNNLYNDPNTIEKLSQFGQGGLSQNDLMDSSWSNKLTGGEQTELGNALATNPLSGSRFATEQVESNPVLGGLYGNGGQLNQAEGKLSDLQNQGFELKPEDQTLYGQAAGNIARQFGQQGNQTAGDLASRGLSSSGAAGAAFSGLAGNQNEMLAQAQQGIMQQRFQNTMGQIGHYQDFVNSMGANANTAINQQYSRQAQGAGAERAGLSSAAGAQNQTNQVANEGNLNSAKFAAANKPKNFMDFATAGAGQGVQSGASSAVGGLF